MSIGVPAPVTGSVWKVLVAVGDVVEADDELVILESMKMEIPVDADVGGTIEAIHTSEGAAVSEDDILLTIAVG